MVKRRYKHKKRLLIFIACFLAVLLFFLFCYYSMRPVIIRFAVSRAETIMLDSANTAIMDVLEENNISYEKIVTLSTNDSGYVTSLETNINKINHLKSKISNRLSEIISKREYYDVSIPLGTFLSNEYTSGFGPEIKFNMQLTTTPVVNFEHKFEDAGINHVLHLVMINIDISGGLIITGFSKKISVSTSAIAAQTVIVGAVPDAITHIIEDESDNTAGLINDYGAGDFNKN